MNSPPAVAVAEVLPFILSGSPDILSPVRRMPSPHSGYRVTDFIGTNFGSGMSGTSTRLTGDYTFCGHLGNLVRRLLLRTGRVKIGILLDESASTGYAGKISYSGSSTFIFSHHSTDDPKED